MNHRRKRIILLILQLLLPYQYKIIKLINFFLNIKYIDNQLVTVSKVQMICKCKYKTI